MMKKIIIFDADGTLFDSMPLYARIFADMLHEKYDIQKKESKDYLLSTAGLAIEKQFQRMLTRYKFKDESDELKEEFYGIVLKRKPEIYDDVIPALKKLDGYTKFLSSGNRQDLLNLRVKQFGLAPYFEEWLGFNGYKDKSQHLDYLMKKLKMTNDKFARNAYYVADGSHDMEVAKKYGIYSFGRIGTLSREGLEHAGARHVIGNLGELVTFLDNRFLNMFWNGSL